MINRIRIHYRGKSSEQFGILVSAHWRTLMIIVTLITNMKKDKERNKRYSSPTQPFAELVVDISKFKLHFIFLFTTAELPRWIALSLVYVYLASNVPALCRVTCYIEKFLNDRCLIERITVVWFSWGSPVTTIVFNVLTLAMKCSAWSFRAASTLWNRLCETMSQWRLFSDNTETRFFCLGRKLDVSVLLKQSTFPCKPLARVWSRHKHGG